MFGQCIEAFKHCRDVFSIDGTFLTWKYEAMLLIAIGIDACRQLVPLAFRLVEKERTSSWVWFLRHVRRVVVGPAREVCIISNREDISGQGQVHHRWCTRHLAQNIIGHDKIRDNFKPFEDVC